MHQYTVTLVNEVADCALVSGM